MRDKIVDLPDYAVAAKGTLTHRVVDGWYIQDYTGKRKVMKAACGMTFYFGREVPSSDTTTPRHFCCPRISTF